MDRDGSFNVDNDNGTENQETMRKVRPQSAYPLERRVQHGTTYAGECLTMIRLALACAQLWGSSHFLLHSHDRDSMSHPSRLNGKILSLGIPFCPTTCG